MNALSSLPYHPLFVHGAVVFIPLAALAAMYFPLVPKHRWVTRWPTAVLQVLAGVFLMASRLTGDPLDRAVRLAGAGRVRLDAVHTHEVLARWLTITTLPMCAIALATCWAYASETPLPTGAGAREGRLARFQPLVTIVLLVLAVTTLVLVALTGDAGARAAWTS